MAPGIRYARAADGARIAYYTQGQGPPLVIVAGGPVATIAHELQFPAWRAWCARLATGRMVVRYDLRGTGLSDQATADFGLATQLDDLSAVVAALALDRCALLAAQHAGPVAIAYAARQGARASHLILWCSYARGADYFGSAHAQAVHSIMAQDWALFTETVAHARLGWDEGEQARRLAVLLRQQVAPAALAAFDAAARATDVTALLPALRLPTLVLHRRQLPHPDLRLARELAAGIPGARLALLEGTSIAPFLGDSAAVERAIAAFLGRQVAPAAAPLPEPLSAREVAVLALLAAGLSNREIADALFITVGTAKTHLNSLYRKLDVHSRTRAIARAGALGLIDPPTPQ